MRYKRIYIGIGTAITSLSSLFIMLAMLGLQITSNGDVECDGTEEDPCISFITIYNPTIKNIFIYNKEQVQINFSPDVESYEFYTRDGRIKKGKFPGWRLTDFTDATKPRKDRIYVFRWSAYSIRYHMLVGYKNNPEDVIKWSIGIGDEELDPIWGARRLKSGISFTRTKECKNISKIFVRELFSNCTAVKKETTCVNDSKNISSCTTKSVDYNYTCKIGENKTTRNIIRCRRIGWRLVIRDNGTTVLNKSFRTKDFGKCSFNRTDRSFVCDSKNDGNADGICQSGESCIKYEFRNRTLKKLYRNSEDTFQEFDKSFKLRGING